MEKRYDLVTIMGEQFLVEVRESLVGKHDINALHEQMVEVANVALRDSTIEIRHAEMYVQGLSCELVAIVAGDRMEVLSVEWLGE